MEKEAKILRWLAHDRILARKRGEVSQQYVKLWKYKVLNILWKGLVLGKETIIGTYR